MATTARQDIMNRLMEHLDEKLRVSTKKAITPPIISEILSHTADFIYIEKLNAIFDQAISLMDARPEVETECEDFISELKKL